MDKTMVNKHAKLFNELSFTIKEAEILQAVKSLKNKKTCGADLVYNEKIKASCDALINPLKTLFKTVLITGHFPA